MISSNYLSSRKKWDRPQAIILSNNSAGIINGVPQIEGIEREDFIILSDHNREEIKITPNRIENRKRMANGHLRSYYIADKITISTSWSELPSRAFSKDPEFSTVDGPGVGNPTAVSTPQRPFIQYTVDGGAGGEDLLRWYNENTGSFYMFLAYDNPNNFSADPYNPENMKNYSDVVEVFFSSFDYSIVKRGGGNTPNFDFWNVSIAFEEV